MRLIGTGVFLIGSAVSLSVVVAWVSGFYSWEIAVPVLFGTLTAGVLAGLVARGQSFGLELNAARLELAVDLSEPNESGGG
ncbi:MAG: hypothetical protein ACR2N5_01855 [Solirubrobacterales bacterium]